jgi:hypothetical protein
VHCTVFFRTGFSVLEAIWRDRVGRSGSSPYILLPSEVKPIFQRGPTNTDTLQAHTVTRKPKRARQARPGPSDPRSLPDPTDRPDRPAHERASRPTEASMYVSTTDHQSVLRPPNLRHLHFWIIHVPARLRAQALRPLRNPSVRACERGYDYREMAPHAYSGPGRGCSHHIHTIFTYSHHIHVFAPYSQEVRGAFSRIHTYSHTFIPIHTCECAKRATLDSRPSPFSLSGRAGPLGGPAARLHSSPSPSAPPPPARSPTATRCSLAVWLRKPRL